jgi:hypothetical protein
MNNPKRITLAEFSELYLRSSATRLEGEDTGKVVQDLPCENSVAAHVILGMSKSQK